MLTSDAKGKRLGDGRASLLRGRATWLSAVSPADAASRSGPQPNLAPFCRPRETLRGVAYVRWCPFKIVRDSWRGPTVIRWTRGLADVVRQCSRCMKICQDV